ncbi:type VII secretion-associated serine protease mycosin [Nocardia sp. NBC_00508]|uniref:type VII secretion-associated serine protease mycosin n=1 Tax=Nocardia sp. NBC_00508 TaxID=2975992 RepID=UPI002E81DB89|nr:type VII secretion-associated serine protease mycosin [Nocardia sp. NBC_00508]WUD68607.1 type VII secretion-associated serine protease mycosin [Nocardia sp. NBC_00508]
MKRVLRTGAAAAVLSLSVSFGVGTGQGIAYADRPPPVDPGQLPSGDPARPLDKTERPANASCYSTQQGGDGPAVPIPQRSLNLPHAWEFSRGEGQLIAVIDTGVVAHPRLPDLEAGGDYVAEPGDGTSEDCDAHGTVVAGIVAAKPVEGQGFSGVAPEARVLSIRQTSALYEIPGRQDKRPEDPPKGYGRLDALASAIRRAADRRASVINISLVSCVPNGQSFNDGPVGAAVRYATLEMDAVVVVAAGNTDGNCKPSNPGIDPLKPEGDQWNNVTTNVTPARYDDYVLTVGSIDQNGAPSNFTVPGPWVGVAAPGEDIVSLDPRGTGTITGKYDGQSLVPLKGTSFAAPYVSGVVALVRARFPELSALDVIKRIQATAHAPAEGWNPYVGYGAIDPIAALTAEVPKALPPKKPAAPLSVQLAVPAPSPAPDHRARNVALIGSGSVAGLLILGMLASFPIRRRFGVHEDG